MTGEAGIVQTPCCDSEACGGREDSKDMGRTGQSTSMAGLRQPSETQPAPTVHKHEPEEVDCGCE